MRIHLGALPEKRDNCRGVVLNNAYSVDFLNMCRQEERRYFSMSIERIQISLLHSEPTAFLSDLDVFRGSTYSVIFDEGEIYVLGFHSTIAPS